MVAVKALSLRRMTDWKQLELFEREAKTLKSLDHPGIPKYIDYLSEDTEKDRGFFLVQASPSICSTTWLIRDFPLVGHRQYQRQHVPLKLSSEYQLMLGELSALLAWLCFPERSPSSMQSYQPCHPITAFIGL